MESIQALSRTLFAPRALARVLSAYALRDSNGCPPREAWRALKRKLERHSVFLSLQKAANKIREESDFALWEISGERFWVPRESRVLPGLIEERDGGMYAGENGPSKDDVVIDCGAHIGTFTGLAIAAGTSRVIAIEPSPENFQCLVRNLAGAIGDGRVTALPLGVWDVSGVATIRVQRRNPAANSLVLRVPGSRPGPRVQLTTLDALVSELQLTRVDFIKLDVEGAELQALSGAREAIKRWRPRLAIAVEHKRRECETIRAAVLAIDKDYEISFGPYVLGRRSLRPQMLYCQARTDSAGAQR